MSSAIITVEWTSWHSLVIFLSKVSICWLGNNNIESMMLVSSITRGGYGSFLTPDIFHQIDHILFIFQADFSSFAFKSILG